MAVAQINLAGNNLCGVYTDLSGRVRGMYTAEGIKAIADSIAVSPSVTSVSVTGIGFLVGMLAGVSSWGPC